ncbi:MAG: DUF3419 domain-containing protein, partial [Myxococcales bacterium]
MSTAPALAPRTAARPKFSIVREDPRLEVELAVSRKARAALVVASGGCTALTLKRLLPRLEVTAFDINPDQLAHIEAKQDAIAARELRALNVGDDAPGGLNQSGHFEGLFRLLRSYVREFVAPGDELPRFFDPRTPELERSELLARWTSTRYWPAAFTVAFEAGLLHAMFGPEATRHAAPGSYPGYFQRAFERGLNQPDAWANPFLQHVLLGCWTPDAAPPYVSAGAPLPLELVHGTLTDVPQPGRFDLFSLSNVFDWSDDALVTAWAHHLKRHAR